jgi:hypothetical protein
MPVAFGPASGPRQRPYGGRWSTADRGRRTSLTLRYPTDATSLARLLPPGLELDGDPVVTVVGSELSDLPWLAGRGYRLVTVLVPVRYDRGERLVGNFELVTWENLADPIISGREELGYNKLFAEIAGAWSATDASAHVEAGWDGFTFLQLEVHDLRPPSANAARAPARPVIHHRYLPSCGQGRWGGADVDCYTCHTGSPAEIRQVETLVGSGRAAFRSASFEELPTLHHVVNQLAALPTGEVLDASLTTTTGYADFYDLRVLG